MQVFSTLDQFKQSVEREFGLLTLLTLTGERKDGKPTHFTSHHDVYSWIKHNEWEIRFHWLDPCELMFPNQEAHDSFVKYIRGLIDERHEEREYRFS